MPTPNELHTDAALSAFLTSYTNGAFFADQVMPVVNVDKLSNTYTKYLLKDMITTQDDRISPTGEANQANYDVAAGSYSCTSRALMGLVSADEIANADDPQKPFEHRLSIIMNKLLLAREIRVADLLMTAGNYAFTANGSDWTATSGTILEDVHAGLEAMTPSMTSENKLVGVCGLEMGNALRRSADLRGSGSEDRTVEMAKIANTLGLNEIFVSSAIKNTANSGQAVSSSRVWGVDTFAILSVPVGEPTSEAGLFAATFRFGGDVAVRRWDEPRKGPNGSEAVQATIQDDEQVVQNDMGYLLTGLAA